MVFEGQTFTSPEFKQSGKPFQINDQIKQKWLDSLPKPKSLKQKFIEWLTTTKAKPNPLFPTTSQTLAEMEKEDIEDQKEDSQGDGLFFDDPMFPEEF